MTQSSPSEAPFILSAEFARALDPSTVKDIATRLVLDEKPLEAWRVLETTDSLNGSLFEIFYQLNRNLDYYGITAERRMELLMPLAPKIMENMVSGGEDCLEMRIGIWLQEPAPFVRALRGSPQGERIPALAMAQFEKELGTYDYGSKSWKQMASAFEVMPELWEHAIKACALSVEEARLKATREGRVGSPGLLLAASAFDPATLDRCLAVLERMGMDPAACCAQRWKGDGQRHLEKGLRENNALSEALAAGNAPCARRILEVSPKLNALEEAERIERVCMALTKDDPANQAGYDRISGSALAVAQALDLGKVAQSAKARPSRAKTAKPIAL